MIRIGVILFPIATLLYMLSFTVPVFSDNLIYNLVLMISSMAAGGLGTFLVFIGVLTDRIKAKKEEDQDDVGQY